MYYHMSLHIIGFFNMISTTTADGHKIVSHIYWILWIPQHIQISPDVDEFLLVYMLATTLALHWLHSHLFHPLDAGSGHGVPYKCGTRCWVLESTTGPTGRAPECAQHPYWPGTGSAYLLPRYAERAIVCGCCLIWHITACYYVLTTSKPLNRKYQPGADDAVCLHFVQKSTIWGNM